MASIKKLGTAAILAVVLAGGAATTSLEAKGKGPAKPQLTTCEYLSTVISYEYTTSAVLVYAMSLYNYFGCSAQ